MRRASSTSLRKATDAPPGWVSSHSQCRGNSVTSRATTPSLGRPRPRGSVGPGSGAGAGGLGRGSRATISSSLPRRSRSSGRPLASLKMWTELAGRPARLMREGHLGKGAGNEAPLALEGGKALGHFAISGTASLRLYYTRVYLVCQYYPGNIDPWPMRRPLPWLASRKTGARPDTGTPDNSRRDSHADGAPSQQFPLAARAVAARRARRALRDRALSAPAATCARRKSCAPFIRSASRPSSPTTATPSRSQARSPNTSSPPMATAN